MRAMWLHYPDDPKAVACDDQYLWGPDMLVAPVVEKGATERSVYLPTGDWHDWWTGEPVAGGRRITRQVDLATMPLYVRAGAIIPLDPVRQYTGQPVSDPTTLQVYSGADGRFTLYDDDGNSLDYLRGQGTWTTITWRDGQKHLPLEPDARMGGKPMAQRPFAVVIVPDHIRKTVTFDGTRADVRF